MNFSKKEYRYCISETTDSNGDVYTLYMELTPDKCIDYAQIRIFSTFSGNNNPDEQDTKWKTTLEKKCLKSLAQHLTSFNLATLEW